ncbi:hypothetical protein PHYBLDRAFT_175989 [Phycomyces blakesleeanus NRRL 1555(-)]|uniref:Uncharacterized protein n=1 Tax=Phycomyces blakesleeanus (strain ATCC 8743b / DSM 1359 / FGSC 10004 / NBRC 33097 / NRRL 1555) TaxID=763407 RepID=A0A162T1Y6_PHYB8|nr:hypothetical protein PHYBLDRAFT_175989 [Phycomyces blakesleeanus NRRL 1555(-)]OAD65602.1 hypothetical protein PHYBLDRAFT_175989 [Phycomyces blakesleeanus NRRL 1555(-)]|eukprot:XP_018283642.1 hypothetical protein PHYBLDRAFT_175989 [Phycomyces blakesleeanus NRRL 1555(-)]
MYKLVVKITRMLIRDLGSFRESPGICLLVFQKKYTDSYMIYGTVYFLRLRMINHLPTESSKAQANNVSKSVANLSPANSMDPTRKRSFPAAVSVLTNKRIATFSSNNYLTAPNTPIIPEHMINAL